MNPGESIKLSELLDVFLQVGDRLVETLDLVVDIVNRIDAVMHPNAAAGQ